MPFLPLPDFDPECTRSEPQPGHWLHANVQRWSFPAKASDDDIRAYVLWLHVHRVADSMTKRAHTMRPSLGFRIKLCAYRVWVLIRAMDGHLPRHGRKPGDPKGANDD